MAKLSIFLFKKKVFSGVLLFGLVTGAGLLTGMWFFKSTGEGFKATGGLLLLPPPSPSLNRTPQTAQQSLSAVPLSPFILRLKAQTDFQIHRINMTLYTNTPSLVAEIHESQQQIRRHLIFLFSDLKETSLTHPDKKKDLQKRILSQLNLFLLSGSLQKVEIQQTVLN